MKMRGENNGLCSAGGYQWLAILRNAYARGADAVSEALITRRENSVMKYVDACFSLEGIAPANLSFRSEGIRRGHLRAATIM